MPYIGQSLTEGTRREYNYTATSGQTVFPAIYTVGAVDVHQNGILLPPSDYTATDGTTVVFATGCAVDDEVVIHCHNTFSVADTYTKSASDDRFVNASGDTMTGTLSVNANVGVGEPSPAWPLHITNATAPVIQLEETSVGNTFIGQDSDIFFIRRGSVGNVSALAVDSAGHVTMPYQPYAQASCPTTTSATQRIPLHSYQGYRGGLTIDTVNNRLNVPVSGVYVIGYHHLGNYGSGNCQVEIRVNGGSVGGSRTQDTNNANDSFGTQILKPLSANDYIEFWCISGAVHGNHDYNSMWAYLLG